MELLLELGDSLSAAGLCVLEADSDLTGGLDLERALELLSAGEAGLSEAAETGYLSTILSLEALALLELGRDEEALAVTARACKGSVHDDVDPVSRDLLIRGRVAARRGQLEEAERLVAEGAELIDPTDFASLHFDLGIARAEVARLGGKIEAAREALTETLARSERKGHLVATERVRRELARLD
jgi:tetratricopeptide (TPR) repeat protein